MSAEENKVHKLASVPNATDAASAEAPQEQAISSMAATNRDMSKVAIIVSLLVGVLLIIFFFGMNRNIAGLTDEVKSLGALREDVSSLDQRMVDMEEGVPIQIKKMIAHDLVNEMAMKASYLGNALDDEILQAKMKGVLDTLTEVRTELEK